MLKSAADVTQLDGLVRYSRGVALSRLGLVACFVILLSAFTPWRMALLGVVEFGLYFSLFLATELALRDPDPVKAHRRLSLQSDILLNNIKNLANLPANRDDILRRRANRESVTSRLVLEGRPLPGLTVLAQ